MTVMLQLPKGTCDPGRSADFLGPEIWIPQHLQIPVQPALLC